MKKRLFMTCFPSAAVCMLCVACTSQVKHTSRPWFYKEGLGTVLLIVFASIILGLVYLLFLRTKHLREIEGLRTTKIELERLLDEKEKLTAENQQEIARLNDKNLHTHRTMKEETDRLQKQIETLRIQLLEKVNSQSAKDPNSSKILERFKNKFGEYHKDYMPPTEREWGDLKKAFISENNAYYHLISEFPKIKTHHVYICMMIRLGITERMMAYALETDNKRVDRLKRQANRILFGEDNARTLRENFSRHFP